MPVDRGERGGVGHRGLVDHDEIPAVQPQRLIALHRTRPTPAQIGGEPRGAATQLHGQRRQVTHSRRIATASHVQTVRVRATFYFSDQTPFVNWNQLSIARC
jgi:hypothetical protein